MPATFARAETDPAFVASGATDAELAAAIALVNAALAAKQESSTAATDAELAAAVTDLNTVFATKQDSATAATDAEVAAIIAAHEAGDATDAELAAAVASLASSIAVKQDAATAATDEELAAITTQSIKAARAETLGLVAETFPRWAIAVSAAPVAGRTHLIRIRLTPGARATLTLTKGATVGSGVVNAFFGLYPLAGGAPLAVSGDRSADINATAAGTNIPGIPLAHNAPVEADFWLAVLIGGATAMPTIQMPAGPTIMALTMDPPLVAQHDTGSLSALPGNLVLQAPATGNFRPYWARYA